MRRVMITKGLGHLFFAMSLVCVLGFYFEVGAQDTIGAPKSERKVVPLQDFSPRSPLLSFSGREQTRLGGVDPEFCAKWNPDFVYRGSVCCPSTPGEGWKSLGRGRRAKCGPTRVRYSYCSEMTDEQRQYYEQVTQGKITDPLTVISRDLITAPVQSQCSVSDGFLAFGKPLIASTQNRILLRRPERCLYFGTDPMIGMLEWVGRQIRTQYPEPEGSHVRLIIGDISAPRGGCISGARGRKAHASHTSGQDVDLAFLVAKNKRWVPDRFHSQFEPETNLWFLKQVFKNPFACIKVVFLDRRLIRKLEKEAKNDPEWLSFRRYVQHMRRHRDHLHIRVGIGPGEPGCPVTDPTPSDQPEGEELGEDLEGDEDHEVQAHEVQAEGVESRENSESSESQKGAQEGVRD